MTEINYSKDLMHEMFDLPLPIGALPAEAAAEKLREVGDLEEAETLEKGGKRHKKKPHEHTQHSFGYVLADQHDENGFCPIAHAGQIEPDKSLKGGRIKITLDRLRIADYPGRGEHKILFKWYAENQLPEGQVEHISFNQVYRGLEGEGVGIIGYPIVKGLNISNDGAAFKCYTVNVQNKADETLLNVLESDTAEAGLQLLKTAQPSLVPFIPLAVGLTKMIAERNKNVPVQDFFMGLDFSDFNTVPTRARLREGSYVAIQTDEIWNWADYLYHPATGHFIARDHPESLLPYNYLAFGISRYEESV